MLFTDSESKYVTMFFLVGDTRFQHCFPPMLSVVIFVQLTVFFFFFFMWYFTMLGPKIVKIKGTYGNMIR